MVDPEQFHARAEECEAKAETAPDPDLRQLYSGLAAQWRDIEAQWRKLARPGILSRNILLNTRIGWVHEDLARVREELLDERRCDCLAS